MLKNTHLFKWVGFGSTYLFISACFQQFKHYFWHIIKGKLGSDMGPFGLVWDTLVSPVSIPGCPTSSPSFPLVLYVDLTPWFYPYPTGWEDERTNCTTVADDCLGHQCQHGGRCQDLDKSYSCHCQPGYTGKSPFVSMFFYIP